MAEVDFGEVMHKFYAGRLYGVRGPSYDDITWLDPEEPKPSKEYLASLWPQIEADVLKRRVAEQRSTPGQYPSKDEMIVALWEMVVENRPEFAQKLQARREEIKAKYPKPTL